MANTRLYPWGGQTLKDKTNPDLKNIKAREDRKARHNERGLKELDQFFELYKNKIEIVSYNPLDMQKGYSEYFVLFRLTDTMKPKQFLKLVIDKIGDEI